MRYRGTLGLSSRNRVVGFLISSLWWDLGGGEKRLSVAWVCHLTNLEGAFSKVSLQRSLQK
jgi:hypothetical protein